MKDVKERPYKKEKEKRKTKKSSNGEEKKKKRIKNNSPINKKASPKSNTLRKLKNNKHTHTQKLQKYT